MSEGYDVVVIGGTPGGIATAVRAAREGCETLLITYNKHLGGMMAGGLSYTDTLTMKARTPLLEEFVQRVHDHYKSEYGPESQQMTYCESGYIFEPHIAEQIFEDLVSAESALTVARGYHPSTVERTGRTLTEVHLNPFDEDDDSLTIAGDIFIEATYEGDLMATAGTDYRIGRESRAEFNEQFAGRIYTAARGDRYYPQEAVGNKEDSAPAERRGPLDVPLEKQQGHLDLIPHPAGLTEIYPKSTGKGDDAIQAYNYRLCLSNDPENRRLPEEPPEYNREDHLEALEEIEEGDLRSYLLLRYLPNNKADMNSADLPGQNHAYPEADWDRRNEIADRHRNHALGLLYFLQNDDTVSNDVQAEAREWGLARDEFTDNNNFPWQFYVRESRRLKGRKTFTENDARHAPRLERAPINEDSIAIAEYPLDSHACNEKRQAGSQPEGFFYASQVTRPAQVSYGTMLPQDIDNLLVPVPLSATHVAYGTIRLEPTWLHIGESAGVAAALAHRKNTTPADIDRNHLQQTLVETGIMLSFFNEFDMETDESWVPAIQYLGTKGYFSSYDARPKDPLKAETAELWVERTANILAGKAISKTDFARLLPGDDHDSETLEHDDFVNILDEEIGHIGSDNTSLRDTESEKLTRSHACEIIYDILINN